MSEEELIKHCEKQIKLCEALGDYKHYFEHQLILNIIQERDKYKEVIEEVRDYIFNHELVEEKDHYVLNGKELLQILDKVKGE